MKSSMAAEWSRGKLGSGRGPTDQRLGPECRELAEASRQVWASVVAEGDGGYWGSSENVAGQRQQEWVRLQCEFITRTKLEDNLINSLFWEGRS